MWQAWSWKWWWCDRHDLGNVCWKKQCSLDLCVRGIRVLWHIQSHQKVNTQFFIGGYLPGNPSHSATWAMGLRWTQARYRDSLNHNLIPDAEAGSVFALVQILRSKRESRKNGTFWYLIWESFETGTCTQRSIDTAAMQRGNWRPHCRSFLV